MRVKRLSAYSHVDSGFIAVHSRRKRSIGRKADGELEERWPMDQLR